MSRKNGDRARFHLQRKTKLHSRSRIRELRLSLENAASKAKPEKAAHPITVAGAPASTA